MKLLHISDLHLGKRLDSISFIDDQIYILNQIFDIARKHSIDAILIAGDIYDRSIPPIEATKLLNDILKMFSSLDIPIYIVGGNHDSIERLSFGSDFLKKSNIYISSVYNGTIQKETLSDEFGELDIYLMPFISTMDIKSVHNVEVKNLTEAFKLAIDSSNIDTSRRNILVAHQFVTTSKEDISTFKDYLGGTQNIDSSIFTDTFDYVALGHIHKPYWVVKDKIRYCGSPLKYSVNECDNNNSVTIVDFKQKDNITFETIPLKPLRNLRKLKGSIDDILDNAINTDDYVDITLTDEEYIINAINRIRNVYPNTLRLSFENSRTQSIEVNNTSADSVEEKSMLELFSDFFKDVYNQNLEDNPNYLKIIKDTIALSKGDKLS